MSREPGLVRDGIWDNIKELETDTRVFWHVAWKGRRACDLPIRLFEKLRGDRPNNWVVLYASREEALADLERVLSENPHLREYLRRYNEESAKAKEKLIARLISD